MSATQINGATATSRRRRRAPQEAPGEPSHGDLMRQAIKDAAAARHDARDARSRTDALHLVVQRVETLLSEAQTEMVKEAAKTQQLLKDIITAIGDEGEDDRGEKIGTGLTGRTMRLETSVKRRFDRYDRWKWLITGGLSVAGAAAAVIWWLVENRVAFLR